MNGGETIRKTILRHGSFSILNSAELFILQPPSYKSGYMVVDEQTWQRDEECGDDQFHNCERRRSTVTGSESEECVCNSLKCSNKQRRSLLHPETYKHAFFFPRSPIIHARTLPSPTLQHYYCQRLLLYYILFSLGSIIINSRLRMVPFWRSI